MKKAGYHHGNLRKTLIKAAADAIAKNGLHELSFRKLSTLAGVSSGAPYHHFRDKTELAAQIAGEGFQTLGTALHTARVEATSADDAAERMVAAFLSFAENNPGHYAVLFSSESILPQNLHHVVPHAEACKMELIDLAKQYRPGCSEEDARGRAVKIWAMMHGLIQLSVNGVMDRFESGLSLAQAATSGCLTLLSGEPDTTYRA